MIMKKIIYTLFLLAASSQLQAQVGIGTNTPDNSAMLEVQSNERGILFPRMTSAQRNGIASPANGLHVFDTNTNSLWFYNGSFWVNYAAQSKYGDVKSGVQTADHEGWVLLDGRAINTLSATQQAVVSSLGLTGNLPDASNAYLSQNGNPMATVSGANTTALTQANLPNVSFSGTAASAGGHNHQGATGNAGGHNHTGTTSADGNHSHTGNTSTNGNHSHAIGRRQNPDAGAFDNGSGNAGENSAATTDRAYLGTFNTSSNGNHSHTLNIDSNGNHSHTFTTTTNGAHTHTISTDGVHTHTVTVSSGGSATPINIAPQTLSVNMFIYLGL
jgi:hypothetical protein